MDKVSQAHVEQEVGARLTERYYKWFSWPLICAEILLWSDANRHRYVEDTDGLKQITAMYHGVAAELEKQKAKQIGYEVDDVYFYSLPHLRELVAQVCAGIHSTRLDAAYADVERALYRLVDPSSRAYIIGWHAGWHEDDERLTEALRALQGVLGGKRPKGLGR